MAETLISPGVLTRENDLSFIQPAPVEAGAAFIGPTVKGPVQIPTVVTSYGDYLNKFGSTFTSGSTKQEFMTSIAVKNYFQQGGNNALITRVVSGSFTSATTTHVSASAKDSNQPFTLQTIGEGVLYNTSTGVNDPGEQNSDSSLVSGSADNLRWQISNVNNSKGTFTLLVRRGDDNFDNPVVLETWNNLSLDPNSENYISKVIGDQKATLTTSGDETYLTYTGTYPNRSRYVRVATVNLPTVNYLANDGTTVNLDASSVSFSGSLPITGSGSFYGATGDIVNSVGANNYFSSSANTISQGVEAGNYTDVINLLANQDEYVFNVIAAPGLNYSVSAHQTELNRLISTVETRGDAIAVVDTVAYGSTVATAAASATSLNTSYAASYWPWLQVQSETGRFEFVPASVVIPGVYAFTDRANAPWFAPAGLTRGGIVGVVRAERNLTKGQRDDLYDANINPIANFPGAGIAVFGQKTLQKKASALDRVNVRRLLIELKKFFSDQARNLVFEQNTIATRNRFLGSVTPYMDTVVSRQGLYAYRVVMDDTNNTNDVIDRNQLVGQVFIQPAKTAEFIILDFTIEPTGATFVA